MSFPHSERVTYSKNPLETVICQLRYPPVLRIETELPARFQETVRTQYPIFTQVAQANAVGVSQDVLNLMKQLLPASLSKAHVFSSEDGVWSLTLTKESLALECKGKYTRWEEFLGRFLGPLQALCQEYRPSFFNRVGLRYVDLVRRSKLGLGDTPWSQLLSPQIAGQLASDIAADVQDATHAVIIKLNDNNDKVRMHHGLVATQNPDEVCYLIDNDFFCDQRTEANDATAKLEELHRESGNCFRWCISNTLHRAMEPQSLGLAERGA